MLVPLDGQTSGEAIYVPYFQMDIVSQTQAHIYKTGVLNIEAPNWPEFVTTTIAKMAAFAAAQSLAIM
ncbi:hypothetical protein M4C69_23740 [Klebsiella pneumoniae]|nr:hypothetical protein [Klebsiella pneumoniae]